MILGPKWLPMILPFKFLCIAQLIVSVTSVNGVVINAKGFPQWNLYLNIVNVLILPVSFYVAAKHGLNYIAIPWLTVQPLIRLVQTWITLRLLAISILDYCKSLLHPVFAVMTMLLILTLSKSFYFHTLDSFFTNLIPYLFLIITIGGISYATYIMLFHRSLLTAAINLCKTKNEYNNRFNRNVH